MITFKKGIAFRLALIFSGSVILIFLIIFGLYYSFTRAMIEKNTAENAKNLTLGTVARIEGILRSVQQVPENMAGALERGPVSREALLDMVRSAVEKNPELYGSAVAFAPYAFDNKSLYYSPYCFRDKGSLSFAWLGNANYRYFMQDWFQIPKELGMAQWSEPYYDEGGGNALMATYSVPFYRTVDGKRTFSGVITADISLQWLREMVSGIKILNTGYAFLLSRNGTFVTYPNDKLIMNETIFGVAEELGDKKLRGTGRDMTSGKTGFVQFPRMKYGKPGLLYYAPVTSSGWSLAVLFPRDELMADITHLNWLVLCLSAAGMLVLFVVVVSEARSITGPLTSMADAAAEISAGNLDFKVPGTRAEDEVGILSSAFSAMQQSLKSHIARLTEATAARERIESELNIAREIQLSILPKIFPPFPGMPGLDLYAVLKSAREVGGDLYDFFPMDEDRFCMVIGDVSGKGVPASLFMAVTKTLFKATAVKDAPPEVILDKVNNELSSGNEKSMFVTAFFAILNTRTGEIEFSNGGHNLPVIIRKDGSVKYLWRTGGMVVGAMEGMKFERGRLILAPGDRFFLYTDGVTEAMDKNKVLFSDERLLRELKLLEGLPVKEVLNRLLAMLVEYSCGDQSDDITMMMLEYQGPKQN